MNFLEYVWIRGIQKIPSEYKHYRRNTKKNLWLQMNTQEFTWIQTEFVRIQWIFLNTSEFAEYRKYRQNTRIAEGIQKSSLITDEYTGIHLNRVLQGRVETEVWRTKRLPLAGEEARRRLSEPHSPPHLSPSQWKSFCSSHFRFGPSLEYPILSMRRAPSGEWEGGVTVVKSSGIEQTMFE